MTAPNGAATKDWTDWLKALAEDGVLSSEGVLHALADSRTTDAQTAYRQVGELVFMLLRAKAVEQGPPLSDLRSVAKIYREGRATRSKTSQSRADQLLARHIHDGSFDAKAAAIDFEITSGKRTTWMAIYYQLQQLNPAWAQQWRDASPLGG